MRRSPINSVTVSGGNEASNVSANDIATDPVTIRQHTTTTVQPATQDFDDIVTLQATVTPAGVSGSVEFFVNGASVGTATYNSGTGVATLSYLVALAAGTYSLEADFTSTNPLFLNSKQTLPTGLTVTLEETTLSYTGDTVIANGGTATMSGVLLEDGVKPIAGRTVDFTLGSGGSAQTCNGVTNASGHATCAISPVAQPVGSIAVGDVFAGDTFYKPASAASRAILFAFLTTGAEVVGDQSAQSGRRDVLGRAVGVVERTERRSGAGQLQGLRQNTDRRAANMRYHLDQRSREQFGPSGHAAVVHGRAGLDHGWKIGPDDRGRRGEHRRGAHRRWAMRRIPGTPAPGRRLLSSVISRRP